MNFLKKIQTLSKSKRKIILWLVMVIIILGSLTFYIKNIQKRIKSFKTEEFKKELNLPSFEMPKIETP